MIHLIRKTATMLLGAGAVVAVLLSITGFAAAQMPTISLQEALDAALKRNPLVDAMRQQRRTAEARVREATGGFLPQISMLVGYTRYQEPNIIIPIHKVGVFPPLDDQIYEARLQLQVPLFSGGRTLANRRAAKAGMQESRMQETLAELSLIERIGQMFIQAQELNDRAQLIAARITSLRRRHHELSLLLQEGRVSPADLAIVTSSLQSARADSLELDSKKQELALRLAQLVGRRQPVYPEMQQGATAAAVVPDTSLLRHPGPQIRQARARVERARAMKSLAVRSFLPEISGFAVYNYRSGADLDFIGEWAAGVTLKLPLFEGGRRIARVKAAQASLRAAENGLQYARDAHDTELRVALQQWQAARERRRLIAAAVASKTTSVRAYQEMYDAGRLSLSDLLVQETELLQLQMQEKSLAYQERMAVLHYYATAGELNAANVQQFVMVDDQQNR